MSDKPTKSNTVDESTSSETSLRFHFLGNIYEIFVCSQEITHVQIHFPGAPAFPSQAHFNDFPTPVQQHFTRVLRTRR